MVTIKYWKNATTCTRYTESNDLNVYNYMIKVQKQFVPKGTRCLPEFYSERLINLQGPLTAGISGVTFQNQMALPLPDYTSTCYNVDTCISSPTCLPIHSSLYTFPSNYWYAVLKCFPTFI